jgi:hypothetical protein
MASVSQTAAEANAEQHRKSGDLEARTDAQIRYIFVEIAQGRGAHGGFLSAYAQAIANADHENIDVTRATSLAIIAKYELTKYLPKEGDKPL